MTTASRPGAESAYEAVIGLEVHCQLLTHSKLFCSCRNAFGLAPNTVVCPVCLGLPGALPVLNERAVELAVATAVALDCTVHERSIFARKSYFYPDLPKGYQISQYERPLATEGTLVLEVDGVERRAGIARLHMEEDAGKLLHPEGGAASGASHVDLNRAGVPLIEIVGEPDLRSPREAAAFLVRLRSLVRTLGVCDGNMEEGSLRCDANVSLRPRGREAFGVKTEIKNLNSFRNVERALRFEIERQQRRLAAGEPVRQETRLWDADRGATALMRSKEGAEDYRYFPEPDLLPLVVAPDHVARMRAELPELPHAKKRRFVAQYGLAAADADLLSASRPLADYFEAVAAASGNARGASNWVRGELLRLLKEAGRELDDVPVPAEHLGALLRLLDGGTISGPIAKELFAEMFASGRDPAALVAERGLAQISDADVLRETIESILEAHPDVVGQYLGGKTKTFGFFVGQVMRATEGKANPKLVQQELRAALARRGEG